MTCPYPTTSNVFFVVDESSSVGQSNYAISISALIDFIQNDINLAKFGALAFGFSVDPIYSFGDDQSSQTGIIAALQSETNDYHGGLTYTFSALQTAINDFVSNNIPINGNNYIVLVTDGVPVLSSQEVCIDSNNTVTGLSGLETQNIRVIVIGVGGFPNEAISCIHAPNDIYLLPGYDNFSFAILTPTLCQTANPTNNPTIIPSENPTELPTILTDNPTFNPTSNPTNNPSTTPTELPTELPTYNPTINPTLNPTTDNPTVNPTYDPTLIPTLNPTFGSDEIPIPPTETTGLSRTTLLLILPSIFGGILVLLCIIFIIIYVYMKNKSIKTVKEDLSLQPIPSSTLPGDNPVVLALTPTPGNTNNGNTELPLTPIANITKGQNTGDNLDTLGESNNNIDDTNIEYLETNTLNEGIAIVYDTKTNTDTPTGNVSSEIIKNHFENEYTSN